VQKDFLENKEWQEIEKLAYPPAAPEEKKKKQKKDKGSRYPGAGAGQSSKDEANLGASAEEAMDKLKVEDKS